MLSIVIPIHNEEPAILPLYDRLTTVLEGLRRPYEIIFVDDASTDKSFDLLANLVETDAHLKVLRLRRNFGQTAALAAGFDEAGGEIIISLDGDLQHEPEDIPLLLNKIDDDAMAFVTQSIGIPVTAIKAGVVPRGRAALTSLRP